MLLRLEVFGGGGLRLLDMSGSEEVILRICVIGVVFLLASLI